MQHLLWLRDCPINGSFVLSGCTRLSQFVAVIWLRGLPTLSIDHFSLLLYQEKIAARRPTLYNLFSIQLPVINIHVNITGLCLSVDGKYYDNFHLSASRSWLGLGAGDDNKKITIHDLYEITHHSIGGGWWPEEQEEDSVSVLLALVLNIRLWFIANTILRIPVVFQLQKNYKNLSNPVSL